MLIYCRKETVTTNSVLGGMLPISSFMMSLLSESREPMATCLPSLLACSYSFLAYSFSLTTPSMVTLPNCAMNLYIEA